MKSIIIGVDPGLTGAIAIMRFYDRDLVSVSVEDIPTMALGKGKGKVKQKINARALFDMLPSIALGYNESVNAVIEKVASMPGQGVASVMSLGHTLGAIDAVLSVYGCSLHYVTPQQWKKFYGIPADKEVARATAIQLFPHEKLDKKKDHNRAEALLIANWFAETKLGKGDYHGHT